MGQGTKIQWTDHSFQPWIGCSKVSPACDHCYAEAMAKRAGWDVWGDDKPRKRLRDTYWRQPLKWNRMAEQIGVRARVFCASLSDVFENRLDLLHDRDRLGLLIEETPWLDWLLLSKRPENMVKLAPKRWAERWPPNVWAGTTVEDQERADERIPWLLEVPARVRFLSVEQMLGKLDLENVFPYYLKRDQQPLDPVVRVDCLRGHTKGPDELGEKIHWVIVGGESGGGARPFQLEWAREVVAQCRSANVSCFVKQMGDRPVNENSLLRLKTRKGGDPSEWPPGDWPREFPEVAA